MREMRAIAGCKDRGVRGLQPGIHPHVAALEGEAGAGKPGLRLAPRGPRDEGGFDVAPVGEGQAFRRNRGDVGPLPERDTRLPQRGHDPAARGAVHAGQGAVSLDEMHLSRRVREPVRHRHGELGARDAGPDDRGVAGGALREEVLPAGGEGSERLGRDRVLGETRKVRHVRGHADVERGDIESDRSAVLDHHLAAHEIDTVRPAEHQPRPGKSRELHQVDVEIVSGVMTCHVTGQHAGIGGRGPGIDQRQPNARERVHPPFSQHQRMGMAATNENEVAREG